MHCAVVLSQLLVPALIPVMAAALRRLPVHVLSVSSRLSVSLVAR